MFDGSAWQCCKSSANHNDEFRVLASNACNTSGKMPQFREQAMETLGTLETDIPEAARLRNNDGGIRETLRREGTDAINEFARPTEMTLSGASCCLVCQESEGTLLSFPCGTHACCEECMTQHFEAQLQQGLVPKCPAPRCARKADLRLAKRVLSERKLDLYILTCIRAAKQLKECPNAQCNAQLVVERCSSAAGRRRSSAKCPDCGTNFCVDCGFPRHTGSCDEGKDELLRQIQARVMKDQQLSQGLTKDVKHCPHCCEACVKLNDQDCDHIFCLKCYHEFCWKCLADRKQILAHGNHFHNVGCPYYAPLPRWHAALHEYIPDKCDSCWRNKTPCSPPQLEDEFEMPVWQLLRMFGLA